MKRWWCNTFISVTLDVKENTPTLLESGIPGILLLLAVCVMRNSIPFVKPDCWWEQWGERRWRLGRCRITAAGSPVCVCVCALFELWGIRWWWWISTQMMCSITLRCAYIMWNIGTERFDKGLQQEVWQSSFKQLIKQNVRSSVRWHTPVWGHSSSYGGARWAADTEQNSSSRYTSRSAVIRLIFCLR